MIESFLETHGLEPGEEWLGSDGNTYRLTSDGRLWVYCPITDDWDEAYGEYSRLLCGCLIPKWIPEEGETVFIVDLYQPNGVTEWVWIGNTERLREMYGKGLVFRDWKSASEVATKIIKMIEEEL